MILTYYDIKSIVEESVKKVVKESLVDDLADNFDGEVGRVCADINEYLSQFGIRAKFNKRYDFSGQYSDAVAIYQRRSVVKDGCMRFSINLEAMKSFANMAEEDGFLTYDDVVEQIDLSLWHECGHGLIEWIKKQRRNDTQQKTGIFKGEKLKALRWLLGYDEEDLVEEFAEQMVFHDTHSDLLEFINDYMMQQ